MSGTKCLVTGATGLLGRQVIKAFELKDWKCVGTGFTRASPPSILKLDLGSSDEISKTLNEVNPKLVVHCAANRFPDKCESDPEGTKQLNVEASRELAQICAEKNIFLIYISTDYVFPGTEGDAPYEAHSKPKPPNLYGETKLGGEQAVLEVFEKVGKTGHGVVLRVPVLYGSVEKNSESAVNVLLDAVWKAQVQTVSMDHWALRYPTNTEDVGRVCADIAIKYTTSSNPSSLPTTLQFSSEDKFTKYEICELLAEIHNLPLDKMTANTEGNDPKAEVQRPYDCHLSTKALKDIDIDVATQDFKGWWRRESRAFRH